MEEDTSQVIQETDEDEELMKEEEEEQSPSSEEQMQIDDTPTIADEPKKSVKVEKAEEEKPEEAVTP